MSTKTTFKRIALVAVAALGFGLLSVVPSTAASTGTAILLKQQGVHVTTAQRLLGHSDPRVTMGIYTQVLDNEIDEVGLLLSKAAGF
jgi:integrase